MMKIEVKETCFVRPAQDTPCRRKWLSSLDLFPARSHVPSFQLFKPDGSTNFFDIKLLKESLSKVLVAFYPMAGRLGRDEKGRIELICNGEGALFVEAKIDSVMDEITAFVSVEKLKQLIPTIDYSTDISSHPLFITQVTKFQCGGVCIGRGVHHTIVDGSAAVQLYKAWADVTRGISITIPPFTDRTIICSSVPPKPTFHHIEYDPPPTMNILAPKSKTTTVLDLNRDQVKILKAKAQSSESQSKYSTYEILTAHIWRCASKARRLPDDQATKLYIAVDGRSRLNPPLPPTYFGNVVFFASPIARSGELLSESFVQTVDRIHREIKQRDNEYLRSAIDYLEVVDDITSLMQGPHTYKCPNLKITSWMRYSFYESDYGWGRPCYVCASTPSEGKGYLLQSPARDESLLLAITFEVDHMKSFQKLFYEFCNCHNKL